MPSKTAKLLNLLSVWFENDFDNITDQFLIYHMVYHGNRKWKKKERKRKSEINWWEELLGWPAKSIYLRMEKMQVWATEWAVKNSIERLNQPNCNPSVWLISYIHFTMSEKNFGNSAMKWGH